jgi:aspartyl-tRNA synthetase
MHRYRTHTCGQLRETDAGATVRLSGWVHRVRDHGGVLFIDLRDHYGLTQVVADPDSAAFHTAEQLRSEWCVRIDGVVKKRTAETVNPNLSTGTVELFATEIEVLSAAKELPLPVFGEPDYPEDTRLKYRFLDLRRETLHANIVKRAAVIASMRRRMTEIGFTEYSTPILTASSPEGARDFLVPSRIHQGKFYALPQAPQQYKQLLMVAGFDRYFQIAPCFRDEDPRADRLPGEFYQLDLEMSFVTQDDVLGTMEPVMRGLFEEFADGKAVTDTFRRIPYDTAIRTYGSDKPDLRNPIEMQAVTQHFAGSGFKVFARMIEADPKAEVWAIPAKGGGSRAFCDRMNSWAQTQGQPGLGYIFWRETGLTAEERFDPNSLANRLANIQKEDKHSRSKQLEFYPDSTYVGDSFEEIEAKLAMDRADLSQNAKDLYAEKTPAVYFEAAGPVAKNLGEARTEALRQQLGLEAGDAVFFVAGDPRSFYRFAGEARTRVGTELGLVDTNRFELAWIVDFPFFEWSEEEKKLDFAHNPFSMPQGGLDALENQDPLTIKAFQYDLVCNGFEIASGGIRNHIPELMVKAFGLVGLDETTVEERFGGLYRAFQYGAPPHGGMAPGIDRIVMLICGVQNLREITLFPMNQQAQDLLMGAPSEASNRQLRELGIRINPTT